MERGGEVRSYHVAGSTVSEVIPIVNANVAKEAAVMTDSAQLYKYRLGDFASHDRVDHSEANMFGGDVRSIRDALVVDDVAGGARVGALGTLDYELLEEGGFHRSRVSNEIAPIYPGQSSRQTPREFLGNRRNASLHGSVPSPSCRDRTALDLLKLNRRVEDVDGRVDVVEVDDKLAELVLSVFDLAGQLGSLGYRVP